MVSCLDHLFLFKAKVLTKPHFSNQRNFISAPDYFKAGNQVWVDLGRPAAWPGHLKSWFPFVDSTFNYVISCHPHRGTGRGVLSHPVESCSNVCSDVQ